MDYDAEGLRGDLRHPVIFEEMSEVEDKLSDERLTRS